eukprot:4594363-Pyramimonas_sp.AAC.1
MLGVGTSRFPLQRHRNPRHPGHHGGKQGVSWHGPPLYCMWVTMDFRCALCHNFGFYTPTAI